MNRRCLQSKVFQRPPSTVPHFGLRRGAVDLRYFNNQLSALQRGAVDLRFFNNQFSGCKQVNLSRAFYATSLTCRFQVEERLNGRKRVYHEDPDSGRLQWQWETGRGRYWWSRHPIAPRVLSSLYGMFLPINYPASVHHCYVRFHCWQALETYVGAVVGVLCNQAMLESLGLSHGQAAAGAVAIQKHTTFPCIWNAIDSHPKTWKAVGEILTTIGSGLQLCTVLLPPNLFLALAATGNIAKATSWALWGATHMCFIRNFAYANNVGDLTAKSEAQGAVALISGWLSGIALISYSHSTSFLFFSYFCLAPLHFLATRGLLLSAEFEILNEPKATLICYEYIKSGTVLTMEKLKPFEKFFGEFIDKTKVDLPVVVLGSTVDQCFQSLSEINKAALALPGENYLIALDDSGRFHVVLHTDAEGHDVLKGLLNAMRFHHNVMDLVKDIRDIENVHDNAMLLQRLRQSHRWTVRNLASFISKLEQEDWNSESVLFNDSGHRAKWTKAPKPTEVGLSPIHPNL